MSTDNEPVITGGCYCGAARYEVRGHPIRSAYCHCTLCQRFNATAFILTIHYPAHAFRWTHSETPEEALDVYSVASKPWKYRSRCKKCGAAIASYNANTDKWSVWGGQLDRDETTKIKNWDVIKPTAHIFYDTRILDVNDGLSKWTAYENESQRIG
ncbi:hypothetical protein FA15DRAFT_255089 [Coprinopsis marcescibilis]|uniref:CENP-V/GFA domain-containing protein n=1 Tax=Coprinopsis marcescibilis TaxID=230819 RepID=A0A5C3L3K6_COPMA|nr:hypothetical protein FA15DRAFT_255089 [Coprinopsis marcescibilis]